MTDSEKLITRFARQVRSSTTAKAEGPLRLGVDLGTANIVLSVVDSRNKPVAGAWLHSSVVRDGVVVDWSGAVQAVRGLKQNLESRLGTRFSSASVAIPPGISPGTIKVFSNVLVAADLELDEVVDEPVAASRVLGVSDGCVIDVGHGTTGVSILKGGKVVTSIDEPTGGHHMTLVLAGALNLSYDKAEFIKRKQGNQEEIFGLIRPTVEKMASIAARAMQGHDVDRVYLVGGSASLDHTPGVFEDVLGIDVYRPVEPLFVTPLGIPMRVESETVVTRKKTQVRKG